MVSYGAQDLLDYAPVAKQNLATGVMSVAEMCKAGGAERQCLPQSVGRLPTEWKIGDKTGNNGKDASGDIAVAWPRADTKPEAPILIAAYTQGGTPNPAQIEAAFARIGRMVAERLA